MGTATLVLGLPLSVLHIATGRFSTGVGRLQAYRHPDNLGGQRKTIGVTNIRVMLGAGAVDRFGLQRKMSERERERETTKKTERE